MISEKQNKTKGKHKKCVEQRVLSHVSNVYLPWSRDIFTTRVQGDVHFNFIPVHFKTLTRPATAVVEGENNIIETRINTSPLVLGSFNAQVHPYVKPLTTWHRNHVPGQLKGPHQLIQDALRRVRHWREMLCRLLCTPEEDALAFEITNASGNNTVDATRAVPSFHPQLHLFPVPFQLFSVPFFSLLKRSEECVNSFLSRFY